MAKSRSEGTRPGEGSAWRLLVKRGKDGRDGKPDGKEREEDSSCNGMTTSYATLAEQLDRSRQTVRATIKRDLQSQGASPDHIRDSLAGFDDLFAESLRAGLAEFARSLDAELHATVDETNCTRRH